MAKPRPYIFIVTIYLHDVSILISHFKLEILTLPYPLT